MKHNNTGPEIWAGIECTINRIGNVYHQQLEKSGHLKRLDDLDKFAALGIKTIRYPILWEQIAPGKLEDADWSWADERLNRLRQLGICPIIGFVHHGSGPIHTDLTDPEFPVKLAAYATAFAARYPWIKYYTPVNEPLTTARFSGLYGHWYPHGHDNNIFSIALINQCKAIVLSMQAIRRTIPDAKLVQTEDLCKIYSTPILAYQAAFENDRRWLSFDLLCGKVDENHPMWDELLSYNILPDTLTWFTDNICLPEIIGINHYLTSNRFLDENLSLYPDHFHGGNSYQRYADVEALRVPDIDSCQLYSLLKEVWNRYGLPIAITEVHLGGHREEQLRWLKECWETAQQLYTEGIDIKAITVWSLLGSFDWNSLVTRNDHFYESGVFDISNNTLRPTALSTMMKGLIKGHNYDIPLLNKPGFWKRADRFLLQYQSELVLSGFDDEMDDEPVAPVLIIESDTDISNAFATCCRSRAIPYQMVSMHGQDQIDYLTVREMTELYKPWAVISTIAYNTNFRKHTSDLMNLADMSVQNKSQLLVFLPDNAGCTIGLLKIMPDAMIVNRLQCSAEYSPVQVNRWMDLLIDKAFGAIDAA
ncbi:family 1 glycosylhydrolase [Chitinophaga sp. LS1]|uniref:family 1 glycosylhydrolase n=1 Tax=Chitinophaga sp. LS1 TaxID=3051176 RepID=UPI002AAC0880|nr:family 1 glycosylhydrolase [Chitinophaga sp. LS1]WPV70310.1 family 1 glycosylhydrolase [Chitinophaga sp. LS1]